MSEQMPSGLPRRVVILGGGPNRIGQGIEFDYCCCHASFALRELGCESIMVNSNPETVSTDYDTSTRLYFEPLTREDVLAIIEREQPDGVIVQLGGQTPLGLAVPLEKAGVHIFGTSPDSIDRAENRERFQKFLHKLDLVQPANGCGNSFEEVRKIADRIGYPVVVRPSYVLGGRGMEIVYTEESLERFMKLAVEASPEHPVLIDKFLEDAIEIDVDAICDGESFVIGGLMEHVEEAGIHSGDSACVIPPYTLSNSVTREIKDQTRQMAFELGVKGLMNVQFAVRNGRIYILEVNPRASRTVPFVSKATGIPLAAIATKVMVGCKLADLGFTREIEPAHISVKESVFPFARFPGVDTMLGPEMKSTGEVMGVAETFGMAFAKSQLSAGVKLPMEGNCFFSVKDKHKRPIVFIAKRLEELGYNLFATAGTARALRTSGIAVNIIHKVSDHKHPNVVDMIEQHEMALVINTPSSRTPRQDEVAIRSTSVAYNVPLFTTVSGAAAAVQAIECLKTQEMTVKTIQEYAEDTAAAQPRSD